jgi:hypothetical protein
MTREIILHIGMPKAGSTFLQQALRQNRGRLAAAGAAYPPGPDSHPGNAGNLAELEAEGFDAIFAEAPRIVLSHEDLFALPGKARALARLASDAGVPVRVVAFLRPFSAFCFGDVSQHLKQHLDRYIASGQAFDGRSVEEMAARRAATLDPAGVLLKWVRLFPAQTLVLAPHSAIPATMERLLGHPGLDWTVPRHMANPSLRLSDCEAIAAMIAAGHRPAAIRAALGEALHRTDAPDAARTPERIARIEALFAAHNQALLDIWGYDNRLPGPQSRPASAVSHSPASCTAV